MIEPGQTCPTCERRVSHPRTESKEAYWVPADEHKAHEEILQAAAQHLGCFNLPYFEFKTTAIALALVLQDESLRGFAERGRALS